MHVMFGAVGMTIFFVGWFLLFAYRDPVGVFLLWVGLSVVANEVRRAVNQQKSPATPGPKGDYPTPEEWPADKVVWAVFRVSPDGEEASGIHGVFAGETEAAAYRDELNADPDSRADAGWRFVAHPYLLGEKLV